LSCRSRTENEEFLLIDEAKEEIILYLMKENYLNEERFTRSYIRGNFTSNTGAGIKSE
jgi:regulatory protein